GNVASTLGYVGAQSCDHPINAIYLWTSGPNEGVLQVQLRHGSGIRIEEFKEKLRGSFASQLPGVGFSFEPSDIGSRVLSFGASPPTAREARRWASTAERTPSGGSSAGAPFRERARDGFPGRSDRRSPEWCRRRESSPRRSGARWRRWIRSSTACGRVAS